MLQQFVRTDDLDKVFAAANAVLAKEKPTTWTLKALNITTSRRPRSALRRSSLNRAKILISYKMHSSKRSSLTP